MDKYLRNRKYVLEGLDWDGEESLLGRGDDKPGWWSCPECNTYVSYEQRESMKGSLPILLWRYEEAPLSYKETGDNGGDEDWVAFVPDGVEVPWWIEQDGGTHFAVCESKEFAVEGGRIFVGSHS
jgi:hypothetical protein